MLKDKTAVAEIGQAKFAKHHEDLELHLACEAISLALQEAGIKDELAKLGDEYEYISADAQSDHGRLGR